MGCFLSCFRGGSDRSGDLHDPLVRENRLGDAFLNDEKKIEASGRLGVEAANEGGVDEELLREANYLKSCGTISQTPPEILEASSPARSEDTEASYLKSHGIISQTAPEILEASGPISSEDSDERNDTSTNVQVMKETKLLEGSLSEVPKSDEPDTLIHELKIDEGTLKLESESQSSSQDNPPFRNIRDQNTDSSGSLSEVPKSDETDELIRDQNIVEGILSVESESLSSSQDNPSSRNTGEQKIDSSDSPYPTPLVLRGDIQTPGTVYTACMGTSKPGKRARASRQFIYPVLRPIENKLQWMELKAESPVLSSNPPKRRNLSADFSEKPQQTFASSTGTQTESSKYESFPFHDNCAEHDEVVSPEEPKGQNVNHLLFEGGEQSKQSSEYGKHGVSSLSYWLRPSFAADERHSETNTEDNVGKEPCYENSVFEVPIFPAFGFNWDNTDNPTPVLPKAWDGNGIPNTTTKYNEDQRVSWHATPFEERLMKVLSDEKPRHGRKLSGKLIHLEENAE